MSDLITFAERRVVYDTSQENVIQPPETVMLNGLIPAHSGNKGMSLPANWLNWLFRELFRLCNRDIVTNASGVGLFPVGDKVIELVAVDTANTNNYIYAVGYKPLSAAHTLKVVSSSVLTLGTPTADGSQPVNGGTSVRIIGKSR